MILPLHYFLVAGIGRQRIGSRDDVRAGLIDQLRALQASVQQAQPVAVASGAAGGDQVFLEAAEFLNWPIWLVLPVPVYLFERDFTSSDEKGNPIVDDAGLTTFRRFCATAVAVEIASPSRDRREAFTRCAEMIVTEADVLVAIWDHEPGRQGGTNEALLLSRQLGTPVIEVDVLTGHAFKDSARILEDDICIRYLGRHAKGTILDHVDAALTQSLSTEGLQAFAIAPLAEQHEKFGGLLADQAGTLARSYKRKNLYAVLAHGTASAVGLFALLFFVETPGVGYAASIIKFAAVAAAVWLAYSAKKFGEHNQWVKARFVREVNRSLYASALAAAQTGQSHGTFVPSSIWVIFRHLRRPLLLFHALRRRATPSENLLSALHAYRESRLKHDPDYRSKPLRDLSQHDFQLRTGEKAARVHHRIEQAFFATTAGFFTCAAYVLLPNLEHHGMLFRVAKWLSVLLPVLSAALLVLPNLWDVHRRRSVAPALARTLARLDGEAGHVERILTELASDRAPALPDGTLVWAATGPERTVLVEAWARCRFASIARQAEHAILTEVIGFKTFVEYAELE